jgi:hypothetical protein
MKVVVADIDLYDHTRGGYGDLVAFEQADLRLVGMLERQRAVMLAGAPAPPAPATAPPAAAA